ncbi:hypothetical protein Q6262_28140, partial [Klebsiella pneumoniae]|nr:hypothetical protein [Klebsiella pneumoniae]
INAILLDPTPLTRDNLSVAINGGHITKEQACAGALPGVEALGLVTLLLAGDFLVRGAVNLALRLGISALLVSLTVVAFGTSAPE